QRGVAEPDERFPRRPASRLTNQTSFAFIIDRKIVTPLIIDEQSIGWNSSLYINVDDYEKAFDSVDRISLWNLVRHSGVTEKIINIWNSYDGPHYRVVH
ncbi:unnamed protein product, partial [Schistosoma curassoni]|uniref:Reverse transcriptase domain-containing protein n=1 Tax=Schistosoma curassoni TaxID=6186 RepID=A0A183JEC2_9TREM